jgi:hypothetical protein
MENYVYSVSFSGEFICPKYDSDWQNYVKKCEVRTTEKIKKDDPTNLKKIADAIQFHITKKIQETYGPSYYLISNLKIENIKLLMSNTSKENDTEIKVNFIK